MKKRGVDFGNEIVFGTASKAEGTKKIYNNIYLSKQDIDYCDYLDKQGISIQFKLIPDEKGLNLDQAKSNFKGG